MVKKAFYFGVIFGLSHYLTAQVVGTGEGQVGIGTDDPQAAALHIVPTKDLNDRELTPDESRRVQGKKMFSQLTVAEWFAIGQIGKIDPLKLEGLKEGKSSNDLLSVDDEGIVKKTGRSTIKGEIKDEIGRGEGVKGILIDVRSVIGTNAVKISKSTSDSPGVDIPGVSITYTPTVNCNALVTISALPLPFKKLEYIYGALHLVVNEEQKSVQYFSSRPRNQEGRDGIAVPPIGNYSTMTRIVPLDAETKYIFKVTARSWHGGEIVFNNDPYNESLEHPPVTIYSGTTGGSYFGVRPSQGDNKPDIDSMKSSMTILFYSR